MNSYSNNFYRNRHERTIHSANTILSIVLDRISKVHSAVDIGCGVGTWLYVLHKKGVKEIQGLDGRWVDQKLLAIPTTCFKQIDLSKSFIKQPQRYDLAISLEVAEHLPAARAKEFISFLTELSDHVLFSAAIPFQGGINHINEQWQQKWVDLFGIMGYVVNDFIRPKIWNDNQIPFWYRQNILFFSNQQRPMDSPQYSLDLNTGSMPINLVHPDLYLSKVNSHINVKIKNSYRFFCRTFIDCICKKFR